MLVPTRLFCVGGIAAFVLGAQEPAKPDGPTPEEQLSALIEKTNSLGSFAVRYQLESSEDGVRELKFLYSAPGRLRMEVRSDKEQLEYVIADERMTVHHQSEADGEAFTSAPISPIPREVVKKGLDEARQLLPDGRIEDPTEVVRVEATLGVSLDNTGKPRLNYGAGTFSGKLSALSWLDYLQHSTRFVSESSEVMIFEGDGGSRFTLQKATGFLESAQISSRGQARSLKLVELDLSPEIGTKAFDHPKQSAGVPDHSAEFELQRFWGEVAGIESAIVGAAVEQFREGGAAWDDAAKSRVRRALEGWYASILDVQLAARMEGSRSYSSELFWWFQNSLAAAKSDKERAAAETEVKKIEEGAREDLESLRKWGLIGMQIMGLSAKTPKQKEMLEIDRAAFDSAFAEHAEKPVLGYFAEQLALAREGKLTDPEKR